jgi:hypothetical protein
MRVFAAQEDTIAFHTREACPVVTPMPFTSMRHLSRSRLYNAKAMLPPSSGESFRNDGMGGMVISVC